MTHDPSKCGCNNCKNRKVKGNYEYETVTCKLDNKNIEFWGKDNCPKNVDTK